jgi:hypothetical protein
LAEPSRRRKLWGLSAGYLAIAVAAAILVAWAVGIWWYFFPVLFIAWGVYGLGLTVLVGSGATTENRSFFLYNLLWGGVLTIVGVELIVNDLYPGNVVLLVVVFILFLAVVAFIGYGVGRKETKTG